MDYTKVYNSIITKARTQDRKKGNGTYYESHHIVPRCMDGTDDTSNLVLLTPREHYICHKLLTKIHPNEPKLHLAVWEMVFMSTKHVRRHKVTSREFEIARINMSKSISESRKGMKFSEEHKKNISLSHTRRSKDVYKKQGNSLKRTMGSLTDEEKKKKFGSQNIGRKKSEREMEIFRKSNVKKKKPVIVDGIYYDGLCDAYRILNISEYMLKKYHTIQTVSSNQQTSLTY